MCTGGGGHARELEPVAEGEGREPREETNRTHTIITSESLPRQHCTLCLERILRVLFCFGGYAAVQVFKAYCCRGEDPFVMSRASFSTLLAGRPPALAATRRPFQILPWHLGSSMTEWSLVVCPPVRMQSGGGSVVVGCALLLGHVGQARGRRDPQAIQPHHPQALQTRYAAHAHTASGK